MKITVIGTGYVGLVTGACLADAGNDVVCVDVDEAKIARINAGDIPIHEPGLNELIARNRKKGRLSFSTDAKAAVAHGLFQIIAVGTPPEEDGSADLRHVLAVAPRCRAAPSRRGPRGESQVRAREPAVGRSRKKSE